MKRKVYEMKIDEEGLLGFKALSFVDDPAIKGDFRLKLSQQIKLSANEEKRLVYGPLLIPEQEIYRVDEKTKKEFYIKFSRETIEKMCYRMMEQGMQHSATEMHVRPVDGCCVVENWLKESDVDKSVALGFSSYPDGTWFVCNRVKNEAMWSKVKAGEYVGYSIEAICESVELSSLELAAEDGLTEEEKIILREIETLVDSYSNN